MKLRHKDGNERGKYTYAEVIGRCKKSPGKNLIKCSAVYIPILVSECHWIGVVILGKKREILLYDPQGRKEVNSERHDKILDNARQLMIDEFKRDEIEWTSDELDPFVNSWSLKDISNDLPRQTNSKSTVCELAHFQ